MNKNKTHSKRDSVDSFDSRYSDEEEKLKESIALMEARLARLQELPSKEILRAKLFQLKLKMESYVLSKKPQTNYNFQYFLNIYVTIVYERKSEFANDLGISPAMLSHLLSGRREPSKEFLYKLMTHSKKVFKVVPSFKEELWLAVFHKDLMLSFMNDKSSWKSQIEKEVSWQGFRS